MLIEGEPAVLLVRSLDLIGTFVFAISGAALGMRRGLDLFGVLVLASSPRFLAASCATC